MPTTPHTRRIASLLSEKRLPLRAFSAALILSLASPAAIPQSHASEDDVKAAYLFNFGKFVRTIATRNEAPPANFDICLVAHDLAAREQIGHDNIAAALKRITLNERIDDRPIRVLHFNHAVEARACSVIFLSNAESAPIEKELASLQGSDALTVSDDPHFLERGGMVQFIKQGNRIRFAVNLNPVTHTNLEVSSELLKVASSVTGTQRGAQPR